MGEEQSSFIKLKLHEKSLNRDRVLKHIHNVIYYCELHQLLYDSSKFNFKFQENRLI